MAERKGPRKFYHISAVARMYDVHPQTLRLYEREGLLKPSRSEGNTRLYSEKDLERLELILNLTRDLGVNLAGVEVILNMRQRMVEIEKEVKQPAGLHPPGVFRGPRGGVRGAEERPGTHITGQADPSGRAGGDVGAGGGAQAGEGRARER